MFGPRPPLRQPEVRYEEALAASPFSDIESFSVSFEISRTVDDLVALAFSMSYASPGQLGTAATNTSVSCARAWRRRSSAARRSRI